MCRVFPKYGLLIPLRAHLPLWVAVAFNLTAPQVAHSVTVGEILVDWGHYHDAIRSAQFKGTCKRTQSVLKRKKLGWTDPYAPPKTGDVLAELDFEHEFLISISVPRIAYARRGETWNSNYIFVETTGYVIAYDGKQTRRWHSKSPQLTKVVKNKDHAEGPAHDLLRNSTALNPVFYSYAPHQLLRERRFKLADATIVDRKEENDDGAILRMRIPAAEWDGYLIAHLQAERGYRVSKVEEYYGQILRGDISMTYANHEQVGWTLDKWRLRYLTNQGERKLLAIGRVDEVSINKTISDAVFTLEMDPKRLPGILIE